MKTIEKILIGSILVTVLAGASLTIKNPKEYGLKTLAQSSVIAYCLHDLKRNRKTKEDNYTEKNE